MDQGVVLGIVGNDLALLAALVLQGLLRLGEVVLVGLGDFLGLLVLLGLAQGGEAGLLALDLAEDGLHGLGRGSGLVGEDLLDERVVGVEHEHVAVRHLAVEAHALLEAAHVLHAAHPLVLRDHGRLGRLAKGLDLDAKLGLVETGHLGAEGL